MDGRARKEGFGPGRMVLGPAPLRWKVHGFTACMECGSLELRMVKASEGGIGVAFFDLAKCRQCGWQGMPLEFDDEASWRAFVAAKGGAVDKEAVGQDKRSHIMACRQCGSKELRLEGTAAACPHCGWRGEPREFQDEASWLAFAQERKNQKGRGGEAG